MATITLPTVNFDLGPRSTPHEIRNMRQSTFEHHRMYGMPLIHKHRWNQRDVKAGRAQICPYHDVAYDSDSSRCPYCFGTGILGGYADAQIIYGTFSDVTEDRIRVGPQGVLLFDREPQVVFPWLPDMGDGDMIIEAEFDNDTQEVIDTLDRFILKDVTPITIRGFQRKVQTVEYKVQQNSQMDRIPDFDILYDVPLVFDYTNVPIVPIPPGGDPGDYPIPPVGTESSTTRDIRLIGILPINGTERPVDIRVVGYGNIATATRSLAIVGVQPPGDIEFFFEPD